MMFFLRCKTPVRVVLCGWFVLLLASLNSSSVCDAKQADWQVGVAKASITPQQPMWMSGYGSRNRPAEGKLTELWAKGLAVQDGVGQRGVLVTLDLVGIDLGTASRITDAAAQKYDLPRESLVLSTTHTHSGPVIGDNLAAMYFLDQGGWGLVHQYTDYLVETVVQVIGEALVDLQPAELSWTVGHATFGVNRRNNAEPAVPELRAEQRLAGPVDHDVPILVVRAPDQSIRTILCGYACHATVLSGYQWCGDWPGYAQMHLEERYPGAVAMMWVGCGADINPLPRRDVELAIQYGQQIDAAVAEALERPQHPISGRFQTRFQTVAVPFDQIPDREQLQLQTESENRFEASRGRILLERLGRDGVLADSYPYPVQTWQLGTGPTFCFLGGEVVVDYALRLKWELDASKTWVAGYCNDVMAYIPSLRVLREGGYEGGGAMLYYGLPSPWAESVEETIIATVRKQVAQMGGPEAEVRGLPRLGPYPDHRDLSLWIDQQSLTHPIQRPEDWAHRRNDILNAMQVVMGRLPMDSELGPLKVQVLQTQPLEGYTRMTLTYTAGGRKSVPADLYLPDGILIPAFNTDTQPGEGPANLQTATAVAKVASTVPAVLALHPTSPLGKRVVAGEGPLPNRNYAVELAQRGYVVLAPDYPSFGDLGDYDFRTDSYLSGTMAAIVNHRRGVDLLLTIAAVDPQGIGVIGHSLGGHNAMFLGVFDTRVRAVVSSCGWDPFPYYYGGKLAGWASDRYMPRIKQLYGLNPKKVPFDFPEVAAAIAPRGFFSSSPQGDSNFDAEGVQAVTPAIASVYRLLQADDRLLIKHPACDHDFPNEIRQQAYQFLDRMLGKDRPKNH